MSTFPLPYNPNDSKVGRIDQGVDITSSSPFVAVASGTVVHIDPNFYNGTPAVYVKLDKPVTVNGRTYRAVYYSETPALVHVGQHVQAGQAVIGPGVSEIGFAQRFGVGWLPAAHGQYTEGRPTVAGGDFLTAFKGGAAPLPGRLGTPNEPPSRAPVIGNLAHDIASPFEAFGSIFSALTSGAFWLRALEVVGGGILLLVGLYLLARNVGLAETPPAPLRPGAELGDQAAAEMQFSAGRGAYRGPRRRRTSTSVDVTEGGQRRAAIRKRAAEANPSDDIPF